MRRYMRRASAPLAALLMLSLAVPAQVAQLDKTEPVNLEMMNKIRAEGMERSKVMETLSYMTDVVGPRLTGSPQMKRANEWTRDKLTEWGLVNGKVEAWGQFGRGWTLDRIAVNVTEPVPFPVIAYAKAWTPGTPGAV
jgi:carboxypeptidase Q